MILYYYTTTQTMQFILTNGNVYATNMGYMNDSEEYVNGLTALYHLLNNEKIIEEWKKKHLDDNKINEMDFSRIKQICTKEMLEKYQKECDSYSISFCVKPDLLSQWSMYAKESGVSLTLDFSNWKELQYTAYKRGGDGTKRENVSEKSIKPKPVYYFTHNASMGDEYTRKTSEKILDDFFLNLSDKTDIYECFEDQWKAVGTYVKRYDFYQEDEQRIVFNLKDLRINPRIDYRNDKNVLKPYLDICCVSGWPITEVTVGPGFNQNAVFRSIYHFLDNAEVHCHIITEGDYWKRVEDYMKKVPGVWNMNNCLNEITQLKLKIEGQKESAEKNFDKNQIYTLVHQTINAILQSDDQRISDEQKSFFKENYFSVSGIVLKKSKIPYIY